MSCPSDEQLRRLLDELLESTHLDMVAGHVDSCSRCQAKLDELTTAFSLEDEAAPSVETLKSDDRIAVEALIEQMKLRQDNDQPSSSSVEAAGTHFSLPVQIGPYRLLQLVGEGGTGRLYRALDENLDRIVAVKTLRPELAAVPSARARFEREARACAALNHDHIVSVYQVHSGNSEEGIPPHLVMEFVEGGSLQNRLGPEAESRRELDEADNASCRVEWLRQTALALDAAHRQGIVHRDIKPSNLLIDDSTGRARVADFGLARLTEIEEQITTEGMIAGTPAYMSPEQIVDPASVDGRSDIYSLGVVLYQVLTGELPFRGIVRMVLHQVLHEEPVPPRRLNDSIPRDLENICLKAMSKERQLRYQSAKALADDLQCWLEGRPVSARPVGAFRRAVRWCQRNPRSAGLGAIVLAVLVAGAVDWKEYDRTRERQRAEAVQLRANALLQKDAANRQRDMVIRALHTLIIEVQNRLQSQPGTQELRKSILEAAQEELDRLAEGTDSGEVAELATAVAQSRLGDIYLELADSEQAVSLYSQARDHLRRCIDQGGSPVLSRQTLARCLWQLGQVDIQLNRPEQAAVQYREALEIIEQAQLFAQKSRNELLQRSVQRDYCLAQQRLGEVEEKLGNLVSAASHYQSAQQSLERLMVFSHDDVELQRDRGVVLLALASLAAELERDGVSELFEQARQSFSALATSQPKLTSAKRDYAACLAAVGSWHLAAGRAADAAALFRQEAQIVEGLAREAADRPVMMRHHARSQLRLGAVLCQIEDWGAAESAIESAREHLGLLTQLGWETVDDRLSLVEADMLKAMVAFANGDTELAESQLKDVQKRLHQFSIVTENGVNVRVDALKARCETLCRAIAGPLN